MENYINVEDIKKWVKMVYLDCEDPLAQFAKIIEELGEVAKEFRKLEVGRGDEYLLMTELGDVIISLVTLSVQMELDAVMCVEYAHNKNMKRIEKGYRRPTLKRTTANHNAATIEHPEVEKYRKAGIGND